VPLRPSAIKEIRTLSTNLLPTKALGMSKAAEYRGLAAKFRREAEDLALAEQREVNLAAAARWEALADDLEETERLMRGSRPGWRF
jgi:hypothetical protein